MTQRITGLPSLTHCFWPSILLIVLISGCGSPAANLPEQAAVPPTAAPTDVAPTLPLPSPTVLLSTDVPPAAATAPVPDPATTLPPSDSALGLDSGDEINAVYPGDTVRSKTGFAFVTPDSWTGISTYGAAAGMQEIVLGPEDLGPDDARPHGMILRAGPLTTLLSRTDSIGDVPPISPPDPATITTPDDLLQAVIDMAEDPTVFTNSQPITIDGREGRTVDITFRENGQEMAQGREAMVLLDDGGGLRVSIFMPPERWDPAPFDALLASMTFFPPE